MTTFCVPADVKEVVVRLQNAGFKAFLVGGCVRDALMGREPKDYDVATSAKPEEVQKLFSRVIPTGIEHGTVTVMLSKLPVEVTTFRTDGAYTDGRRPDSVVFVSDIMSDLSRRDFTVNAMAYDPVAEVLVDPFSGQEDLTDRRIRCVGNAEERFAEDGLRAMRAIRFATTLEFYIDGETFEAIGTTLPTFQKIAMERVQAEFVKILMHTVPNRGVTLLYLSGLMGSFLPEARSWYRDHRLTAAPDLPSRLATILTGLAPEQMESALRRMKFDNATVADTVRIGDRHLPPRTATDHELRLFLREVGPEYIDLVLDTCLARGRYDPEVADRLVAMTHNPPPLYTKDLALNGRDVMEVRGTKGQATGRALTFLMTKVLEDPTLNTRETLTEILKTYQP